MQAKQPISVNVGREGDWMPVDELRTVALDALQQNRDVVFDLKNVDHLDCSALQILLALVREQQKLGRALELKHVSASLKEWFAFAGAADQFSSSQFGG